MILDELKNTGKKGPTDDLGGVRKPRINGDEMTAFSQIERSKREQLLSRFK